MKIINLKSQINFNTLKLICIVFLMSCVNCNAQTENCKYTDNYKSETTKTYEAKFYDGIVRLANDVPQFKDAYTYNSYGDLVKHESTTLIEDGKFITVTTYNYDNKLLKEIDKSTYYNDEEVEELSEKLLIQEYNGNLKPIVISGKKDSINKVYTYKNCLKSTEEIIDLTKDKVVKESLRSYYENGLLASIIIEYNFEERVSEKMLFMNYEYNNKGDWISRVIKRSDDTYLIEKREVEYR